MTPGSASSTRRPRIAAAARGASGVVARGVIVLWAVASLTFFALRLVPGDPALAALGGPGSQASPEALALVREQHGLDQPLLVQYASMLGRLLRGDLGQSYALKVPVADLLGAQLPGTVLLAAASLLVAWLFALALALWSTGAGRAAASVANGLELTGAALPHFWLATVLIALFSTTLGWFPPVSTGELGGLVLPVLTLAIPLAGFLAALMREGMLDALAQPFVLSARARGEGTLGVSLRHTIRHAAIPAVALSGWALGTLLSGAVVVETIFARPGLGRTLLQAVTARDVPVVTGVVLVVAVIYVLMTLLSDVASALIDPRRHGRAA